MNSMDFAINREIEGEKYYRAQALLNTDNFLAVIFVALAEDENKHANILQNKEKEISYELEESRIFSIYKNSFASMDMINRKNENKLAQLEVYRAALEIEKESIDLYKEFLSEAKNEVEKNLFQYLIKEEEKHFQILEDIVFLVNRPEEWIESAEFGLREEY